MMSRSKKMVQLAIAKMGQSSTETTANSITNHSINDMPVVFFDDLNMNNTTYLLQESNELLEPHYFSQDNQDPPNEHIILQESSMPIFVNLDDINVELAPDISLIVQSSDSSIVNHVASNDAEIDENYNNMGLVRTDSFISEGSMTEKPNEMNDMRLVPYSDSDCSLDEPKKIKNIKRRKRCQVDESTWNDSRNALNREKGRKYFGRKKQNGKWNNKVAKSARNMKVRCKCDKTEKKSVLECFKILDKDRQNIFDSFWLLNWGEKKIYVDSLIKMIPTVRHRDRKDASSTKRLYSMYYHLKVNDQLVRVCKTMFLNTLDLGKTAAWNWKHCSKNFATARKSNQSHTELSSAKKVRKNAFQKQVESLKEFFDTLPKMESHYCRKETSKLYLLPEWTSKKALYDYYVSDWCKSHDITAVSVATFYNNIEKQNISLFHPKKDACEKCTSHKLGFVSDVEHKLHMERKEAARVEKDKDKDVEGKKQDEIVFTVDVQALLSAPKSNVSSLYYKSKLNVHNFCAFNLKTKEGYCFLWNETEGGVSADEFSSVLVKLISDKILPQIQRDETTDNTNNKKIIVYSDGCAAQNRLPVTVSNALINVAMTNNITIEQKYLEVGHTQMEVDSMHASIERALKDKLINVPAEYITICKKARKVPGPYVVEYLQYSSFKSFDRIQFLKSIRPGKKKGDPKVLDIRALQYTVNGNVYYKLKHSDEWQLLPQRRESLTPIEFENLPKLFENRLPITRRKFEDLQDLKTTIPSDYHPYYDNLPHK